MIYWIVLLICHLVLTCHGFARLFQISYTSYYPSLFSRKYNRDPLELAGLYNRSFRSIIIEWQLNIEVHKYSLKDIALFKGLCHMEFVDFCQNCAKVMT